MIIDSHTHAWRRWPFGTVPDDESRGSVDQLIYQMDQNGVDQAVIVCVENNRNEGNNDYIAESLKKYQGRLHNFADIDSLWSKAYHTAGGAERLEELTLKYDLKGFTHYLDKDYDWFETEDAHKFFSKAEKLGLIISLAMGPQWHPALRNLAAHYPGISFLLHHMAGARAMKNSTFPYLQEILASAKAPNIYVKIVGFHHYAVEQWDYPFKDMLWIVRVLYDHYSPARLLWGSDYPVSGSYITYRQSLELFRTHCNFIPEQDKVLILGENMHRLLTQKQNG